MPSTFYASTRFFGGGLTYLTSKIKKVSVCSAKPLTYTSAWVDKMLVKSSSADIFPGAMGSTTSGYVVKSSSRNAITVTNTGVARAVAFMTSAALDYVVECTTKSLGAGDSVSIPSVRIRIANPTSS